MYFFCKKCLSVIKYSNKTENEMKKSNYICERCGNKIALVRRRIS